MKSKLANLAPDKSFDLDRFSLKSCWLLHLPFLVLVLLAHRGIAAVEGIVGARIAPAILFDDL